MGRCDLRVATPSRGLWPANTGTGKAIEACWPKFHNIPIERSFETLRRRFEILPWCVTTRICEASSGGRGKTSPESLRPPVGKARAYVGATAGLGPRAGLWPFSSGTLANQAIITTANAAMPKRIYASTIYAKPLQGRWRMTSTGGLPSSVGLSHRQTRRHSERGAITRQAGQKIEAAAITPWPPF